MKLFCTLHCFLFSLQLFAVGTSPFTGLHPTAVTLSITTVNTTCQKLNGKIIVQATGGVAPYSYSIGSSHPIRLDGVFYRVFAGTYTVTATDAIGNSASQTVTLTNTGIAPLASVINVTAPTGCIASNAVLTLSATGGTGGPYLFSLNNSSFQSSNVFSNLTSGEYYYIVKDVNGCTSATFLAFNVATVPNNCSLQTTANGLSFGCNPFSGSIIFNPPTGGVAPYMFSEDGVNYQTSNILNFTDNSINKYWIKDATGSIFLYSASFVDICDPSFHITTTMQAATCGPNGSITVTAIDGTAPYSYSLDGVTFQAGNQFTSLNPGVYTVTVKDFYAITSSKYVTVPNHCTVVTATTTSTTCGNSNGKITAQASGGTAPYLFSLDGINYSANNIFSNLAATSYTVYGKDATGAVGTKNLTISNIAGPQISTVNIIPTGCDNRSGIINVIANSGTAPFVYSIDGITFQSSAIFSGLQQGSYTATIKDGNGCVDAKAAIVTISSTPPVVNLGIDVTLCEDNTLTLDAINSNSTYLWQDNSTDPTYLVNKAGRYFVTVSKQGCIAKDTIDITYNLKPKFSLSAESRICVGSTIILDPKINNVSYLWQDGSTNATYTVTQPGLYSLTASNNCGPTTASIIIGNGVCDLYVPNSFTPNGDSKNDLFKASYGDNITEFRLQVFNRYGQIVFEAKDKNKGWDGSFLRSQQPAGVYAWVIQYKTVTNTNWQKLQGTVLLLH
jgi:gliding motility-associated-like protein